MSSENLPVILSQPIEALDLSNEFKRKSKLMGYQTLGEITETAPDELRKLEGFDYNWLGELITFFTNRKLLYLLQPLPGNNPG